MALTQTREIDRARDELAHHAADVVHMRREIKRLENVIARDLAEPVRVTAVLLAQLAGRCGDELGPDGQLLLENLEHSVLHMQTILERLA